ncbi:MAG: hypothetical protein F2813_07950 [Actinobacteria bacterium]|uniref:Unannotated protein n=1 Tax=freshwater metagenome TaxID=449393 RepID=A0A6J5ZWN6_9ZZZZ|nr:hypothetical protein [Actinomycetota bacterium]
MTKRLLFSFVLAAVVATVPAAAASAATAKNPWRQTRPWNICHQGGEDEFPGNTMYAFKRCLKVGGDMLELDIGVTKDDKVIIQHNTTVDSRSSGTGNVSSFTLAEIQKLDNAYWYSSGDNHYSHEKAASEYKYRGIATGARKAPKGYKASDFRISTLKEVIKAFPHTPINVEIKGRTPAEDMSEYLDNARVLANELKSTKRKDIIVVSFRQDAVDLFHTLAPNLPTAPGINGMAGFLLGGKLLGEGSVAMQVPIHYTFGGKLLTTTKASFVEKAHKNGYAWHNWFGDTDQDAPVDWKTLISYCVDGVMTSRPAAFEKTLKATKSPAACKKRP